LSQAEHARELISGSVHSTTTSRVSTQKLRCLQHQRLACSCDSSIPRSTIAFRFQIAAAMLQNLPRIAASLQL
jgi:hypothetical protein